MSAGLLSFFPGDADVASRFIFPFPEHEPDSANGMDHLDCAIGIDPAPQLRHVRIDDVRRAARPNASAAPSRALG